MDLVGHDFLTLLDFTPAEIGYLLDLAAELKAKKKAGIPHDTLRGKNARHFSFFKVKFYNFFIKLPNPVVI